jgi:hypothetical protein
LPNYLNNLRSNFSGFELVSDEKLGLPFCSGACYRWFFTRIGVKWAAFTIALTVGNTAIAVDASGRVSDLIKHSDQMESVLATFRAFPTREDRDASIRDRLVGEA